VSTIAATGVVERESSMRWAVVGLLSIGMVIAYIDRVNLTAAMPVLGAAFGLDKTQQGLALSAFFWTYTLFQIPCGLLVDRYGVRTPYFIGFLVWTVASAGIAMTTGLTWLVALRLILGIGEAVVTPSSMRYISLHFAEKQRGLAVGLYMTGTKVGPAVGFPLSAYLVTSFGWQSMFVIVGVASLLWLIPWMLWVKSSDIAAQPKTKQAAAQKKSLSFGQLLTSPVMWGIILGTYCYMYFVYYCMTWMPLYFKEQHGMSITQMGWYSGVSFGGMAAVAALAGFAADWLIGKGRDPINVRKGFTIAGFVMAATQTISVFTDSVPMMIFFTVFSLCGLGLATANYWALTQTLVPGGSIALVVGIQNTAANLAGIVAPWLTGWMIQKTGSFDTPIKAVGVWLVLGIASYLFLVRRRFAPK
jgi:MFS family permease